MKTINIEIVGKTPLLMNKYNVQAELDRQKGKRVTKTYEVNSGSSTFFLRSDHCFTLVISGQ